MPRSTTIWAAALVLASLSGSGSILTTAEAMPAPGPQETAGRPRYYFPRHVKRQIVTNSTAPASATSSSSSSSSSSSLLSSSSSSSSDLELRQSSREDLSSFFESFFRISPSRSPSSAPSTAEKSNSTTSELVSSISSSIITTTIVTVDTTVLSVSSSSLPVIGTGNLRSDPESSSTSIYTPPPPIPVETSDVPSSSVAPSTSDDAPKVGSTGGLPTTIIQPTSTSVEEPQVEPSSSSSAVETSALESSVDASTGGLPQSILRPTSSSESDPPSSSDSPPSTADSNLPIPFIIGSTGGLPSSVVLPTTSPLIDLSSDIPIIGSTGGLPSSVIQPTDSPLVVPSDPVSSDSPASSGAASTGGVPESVVQPSSTAPSSDEPVSTSASSIIQGPFILPPLASTGGLPDTILQPTSSVALSDVSTASGLLPSDPLGLLPTGSEGVLPTSDLVLPTSDIPLVSLPTSGIVVGITTAFSITDTAGPTDAPTPTVSDSAVIPTSESNTESEGLPIEPSLVSSLVSQLSSILQPSESLGLPSGVIPSSGSGIIIPTPGPTAETSSGIIPVPIPSLSSELSSAISVITSDIGSIVSSVASELPTSVPDVPSIVSSLVSSAVSVISSDVSSIVVVPTGTAPVTSLPLSSLVSSIESQISSDLSSVLPGTTSGVLPPSGSSAVPSGTGLTSTPTDTITSPTGILTNPTSYSTTVPPSTSSGVPASEETSGAVSTTDSSTIVLSSSSGIFSENSTGSGVPSSVVPTSFVITSAPTLISTSESVAIPFIPAPTSKPKAPASIVPTGSDSATIYIPGSSIIVEPSTAQSPLPTTSGIPTELPKMISPPEGVPPTESTRGMFLGQIGFEWPLNWPFVCANDGGTQIFGYLPKAIFEALNITEDKIIMQGLKPLDTSSYTGFVTTLALFWMPSDLAGTLQAQLRNPPDAFWHNKNETVQQLTDLVNSAIPLQAGSLPGDGSPSLTDDPASQQTGGSQDGGALGGDISGSHKVQPTSVGIGVGAVLGALAYGSAMFFVARRYRNRKLAHRRTSSVPSTSRYTYGSMQAAGPAWMSGARNGRLTPGGPGSRGSRGSSSSNGRSIRTQQISAPVMAENSLGWN